MEERLKQDIISFLRKEMKQRGFNEQETDLACRTYEKMLLYPWEWEPVYIAPSEVFGKKLLEITESEPALKDCTFNALLSSISNFMPTEENADKYRKAVSYSNEAVRIYEEQVVGSDLEDPALISEIYWVLKEQYGWLAEFSDKEDELAEEIEYKVKAVRAEEKVCENDPVYSSVNYDSLAYSYKELGVLYKKYADSLLGNAENYLCKALDIYVPLAEKNDHLKYDLEECREALDEVKEAQGWRVIKE